MSLDDHLRRSFDSLAERVREETARQLEGLKAEFAAAVDAERAAAAAEARRIAEEEAVVQLNAIVTATEARARDTTRRAVETARVEGHAQGLEEGRAQGRDEGRAKGFEEGRAQGRDEGRAAGIEAGRAEGRIAGLEVGRAEGRVEGREQGFARGREEGLAQGRRESGEEGRLLGRAEGLEEGRDIGRLEGLEQGRREGSEEARKAALEAGARNVAMAREAGREEGLLEGRAAGREAGFAEGHAAGLNEGRRLGREDGFADGRAEGWRAGRQAGFDESQAGRQTASDAATAALDQARTAELAANERLIDAIRRIDAARSLTEVLDVLASSAGREARRVAVLLVRNGHLRGWRCIGFDQTLDDVTLPSDEAGAIAEAARTGQAVSADSAASQAAPAFAALPPGRELLAVPVQMSGQVVAVLYADQGASDATENLSWPTSLEALARHAARCLEAITAFRAAQVLTERPEVASTRDARLGNGGGAAHAGDAAEQTEAARRYARLLVSEIKLYHEPAVIAGRRERDLATRLGGEIARARVLYELRVPRGSSSGIDYFQEELVKTLADGDSTLLELNR